VATADLHRELVDLDRLVLDIETRLRRHSHGRRVVVQLEPELQLSVDRTVFAPAFEDVLTMAWDLTRGRDVAHIAVGRLRGPDGWAYYVRDDGAGTAVEVDDPDMATFRDAIATHGGRVWIESAPGAGTTIYFTVG
jgi:light-regulated signal transduction histidine kinase (bacteriophytochrome)